MKKLLFIILSLTLLIASLSITVSASFGTGASVVASNVSLVKTGLLGQKMTFSDTDFKTALGIAEFDKIVITSLPSSSEGTLMVGERRAYTGQSVKRKNLTSLSFIPKDESVAEGKFEFRLDGSQDSSVVCRMRFIDRDRKSVV